MKPFLHTVVIWILSLSLIGMPIAALSQTVVDLVQAGKDTASEASVLYGNDTPCHRMSARTDVAATQIAPQVMKAQATGAPMDDDCCITDCHCQYDMACQTDGHFSFTAILSSIFFISSPLNSQLIFEAANLYHYRDVDLAIIPPIA